MKEQAKFNLQEICHKLGVKKNSNMDITEDIIQIRNEMSVANQNENIEVESWLFFEQDFGFVDGAPDDKWLEKLLNKDSEKSLKEWEDLIDLFRTKYIK